MHELAFADAARPTPVVVLNLPLADYSIGHELLLLQRRNALVLLPPEAFQELDFSFQIHAIREAVWLCSDPFSVRERFERPARVMWRFRWNEWKRQRWVKRLKNLLPQDYALAAADFRNYLEAARPRIPAAGAFAVEVLYGDDDAKGRSMGQPMVLSLYHFVISLPKEERPKSKCAWDFPYAMATWLFFSRMESLGNYRIENFEERDEQSVMDSARAGKSETLNIELLAERNSTPNAEVPENKNNSGLATPPPDMTSRPGGGA